MITNRYGLTVSRFTLFWLVFTLSSCTYFSPSISLLRPGNTEVCNVLNETPGTRQTDKNGSVTKDLTNDPSCKMQSLYKATESLSSAIDQLEKKRNWSLSTNRTLGAATFGLGVVAVGHGIHSGHANAIKNASLGAGVAYMSSTLFTPVSQTQIYQSGLKSLTCIQNKASNSLALTISADKELSALALRPEETQCQELNAAIESANLVKKYAMNNDALLGSNVSNSANLIVNEINSQIINDTPNPIAFFEAARTVGQLPPFVIPKTTPSNTADIPGAESPNKRSVACSPIDTTKIAQLKSIESRFTQAVNELDKLGEKCTIAQTPIDLLVVGEEEFTVTQDLDIYQINVSGGKKPYSRTLSNQLKGLNIQMGTDTLIIAKGENLATSGETKVTIKDSSLIPQTKVILINIQGPAAAKPPPGDISGNEKSKVRAAKRQTLNK